MGLVEYARILCTCIIVLILVTGINSQASFITNSENPEKPGFCHFTDKYSPEGSKVPMYLKPGDRVKHPKTCFEIQCTKDLGLSVTGCGVSAKSEKCTLVKGNKLDPYPSCCDQLQCQD